MPLFMSWQSYYNKFTSVLACICTSSSQFLVSVLAVQISKIQRLKVPSSCDLGTLNNFLGKNHLPFQACSECIPWLFTGLHKYENVACCILHTMEFVTEQWILLSLYNLLKQICFLAFLKSYIGPWLYFWTFSLAWSIFAFTYHPDYNFYHYTCSLKRVELSLQSPHNGKTAPIKTLSSLFSLSFYQKRS